MAFNNPGEHVRIFGTNMFKGFNFYRRCLCTLSSMNAQLARQFCSPQKMGSKRLHVLSPIPSPSQRRSVCVGLFNYASRY